mmetsp:Transcript_33212/g.72464  ORF Transcript_33212/g.72464 Transcript_33212/m.72464 type:complete len:220 (+) Transcript_33212:524-1183(+)
MDARMEPRRSESTMSSNRWPPGCSRIFSRSIRRPLPDCTSACQAPGRLSSVESTFKGMSLVGPSILPESPGRACLSTSGLGWAKPICGTNGLSTAWLLKNIAPMMTYTMSIVTTAKKINEDSPSVDSVEESSSLLAFALDNVDFREPPSFSCFITCSNVSSATSPSSLCSSASRHWLNFPSGTALWAARLCNGVQSTVRRSGSSASISATSRRQPWSQR